MTSPTRCCTAHRDRFVVYAATDACLAVVDVLADQPGSAAPEVRWRSAMRLCPVSSPEESITFVAGHPERAVVCVGTAQHGLYVTSLTNPSLTEATKLPRSVTGDCTYGAAFLFTEEANYLAFSSLLHSRPSDPTPHRLSLWNLDTKALLWRGAMGPLRSMCSFAYDLAFAACSAGKVGLFSVQSSAAEGQAEAQSVKHGERNRLMVLSRHCSAVDELSDVTYACCTASSVEREETYLALTTSGFLVAFSAATGSVVRWMDCKVPAATALCSIGKASLLLTGGVARLFHAGTWEFQGKVKWHDALATDGAQPPTADGASLVFTGGASAGDGAVALFHSGGALSLYTTEAKAGTQRLALHRASLFAPPPLAAESPAEVWALSRTLWCWWTPQALLFVTPPGCALHSAVAVASSCATLHPASGAVIVFDTTRRALVAYGRTSDGPAELASAPAVDTGDAVVSLASSAAGDAVYALVTASSTSAAAPRLRRFQCGWTAKEGGGGRVLRIEQAQGSGGGGSALPAVPTGTHSVVVYSSAGGSAADSDIVVAVQRSAITVLPGAGATAETAGPSTGPTYTHADPIARVVQCRDGLVIAGAATCAHVQLRGGGARWVMKALPDPDAAVPVPAAGRQQGGAAGPAPLVACAVARNRADVVVVCRASRLCAWQLNGDAATLIAARPVGPAVHAVWSEEEKEAASLLVWTLGPCGVEQHRLGPLSRSTVLPVSAEKLLPRPGAPAPATVPETAKRTRTPGGGRKAPTPASASARVASSPPPRPSASLKSPSSPPTAPAAAAAAAPLPTGGPVPRQARTPRALASTAGDVTRAAVAEARRQRRTASAGAPSSRELSDRFTELTGFYARQKRDKSVGDHVRTPRSAGAGRRSFPSTETDPGAAAGESGGSGGGGVPQPSHTPRPEAPAATCGIADSVAEAVDVSALTMDSQVLRAPVPAPGLSEAAAGATAGRRNGASAAAAAPASGGPAAWVDSPPQRHEARRDARRPPPDADDAVLHSSASNGASKVSLFSGASRAEDGPRTSNGAASAATTAEQFSVHARHLRESLLNLKELLEQSELADAAAAASTSEVSLSDVPEADLDELSSLLSTVAAQLQLRQVRRSVEAGVQAAGPARSAAPPTGAPDTHAAVATELARIQAQNTRLEEQNRIILAQLRGGQH